jgi:hypothetical protein
MDINQKIETRLQDLISQGGSLSHGDRDGVAHDDVHMQRCAGWIGAARNITQLILPDEKAIYRKHIEEIAIKEHGWTINQAVGQITELLKNLLIDMQGGLLSSIVNQTRAEVFDDFLDHAKAYHSEGHKNESGVIAGVVFEDTLRRICKNNDIDETGKKLDALISELSKDGILTAVMAKRARVSGHVRTKATHAQWDEFDLDDVDATIKFTDELIQKKIDD